MKRSPHQNPNHPSPSTSSSSSSCVLDDHPSSGRPLKQNARAKRVRKRAIPQQCSEKEKQINSTTTTTTTNCDTNTANSNRRSSVYRGVTRHRWTGRFEAHLWDKSSYNSIQNKKGKQVYLGAYDCEDDAARTYDLAALKYWGPETILNFPSENYTKELEEMQNVSKEEYLASLRRQSSGFSRGVSKYRGVAKHHHNGRWEARIGRVFGNKYLYLGTFMYLLLEGSQEEAAKAYDLAAIQYRGRNAITNFDINNYIPKDELQQDENPTTLVESNKDQDQDQDAIIQPDEGHNQEHQEQEQNQQTIVDAFEESELANAFNESPILVMDGPGPGCGPGEPNDDPWSFSLQDDGGGYDPLLVPHIFHDEEDGNLLELLDPKAFEDDIHLIFDGFLEGMENGDCDQMKEEKMMEDKSSFDSSSPSSTVTIDLF